MRNAAVEADSDQLDAAVDFPAVRESLKAQLNVAIMTNMQNDPEMRDNPFAGLGAIMIPAIVEKAVEAFVTPDGIAAMVRGQKPNENASSTADSNIEITSSYINLDRFRVATLNTNTSEEGPSLIFERRGYFAWKLIKIELPANFMDKPKAQSN